MKSSASITSPARPLASAPERQAFLLLVGALALNRLAQTKPCTTKQG